MYRHVAMRDHLWGDRDINSKEERRKKARAHQEELKRQIAENEARKRNSDDGFYSAKRGTTQPHRNSYDSAPQNYSKTKTPTETYSNDGSSLIPTSTFGGFGTTNSQFTETLRAQIDAASRAGSSTEVSIPPLSTVTPSLPITFSTATRFDEAKFEFTPNMTRSFRGLRAGGGSRISPVTMHSTITARSQFNSSFDNAPKVDTSALRQSKIATPQAGFSMRASSNLASTWGGNNFASTL